MVYQQITTAIKRAYRDDVRALEHLSSARQFRAWVEDLELEGPAKASLMELAKVLTQAFEDLAGSHEP
jgi:hypothetical protein